MTEAKNTETIMLEEDAATEDGQVLLPKGTVITLRRPRGGALRGANLGGLVRMDYDEIARVAPRVSTPILHPHILGAKVLEAVRDHGSISAAGRAMGMSYRRAWLLVDALNALFEEPVIETKHGGQGGGGAGLTPFGHRVVAQYRTIEEKAQAAIATDLAALAAVTRSARG